MPTSLQDWVDRICAGNRRAMARAITAVENRERAGLDLLKALFPRAGRAYLIGITGAPGVGKSTLVEKLAGEYRRAGRRVGILAVDPTSPFTGGALLGDRIRLQELSGDDGVYIRSMATRGHLGGLAVATFDAVTVLDAGGCEVILIETVGVGQDEVEIARLADATALLLVPGAGDDVQSFKAGIMEIADIFIINKADRAGADRLEHELTAVLSLAPRPPAWRPPVVKTVARTGEGITSLRDALEQFRAFGDETGLAAARRRERWRARLLDLLRQRLLEKVVSDYLQDGAIQARLEDILAHRRDPHSVVEEVVSGSLRDCR